MDLNAVIVEALNQNITDNMVYETTPTYTEMGVPVYVSASVDLPSNAVFSAPSTSSHSISSTTLTSRSISSTPIIEPPMKELLNKISGGKAILMAYNKLGCLTENLRKTLVHLLIRNKVDKLLANLEENATISTFKITQDEFKQMANDIEEFFESENSTMYYDPHRTERDENGLEITMKATGRLLEHYRYQR